VTSGKVDKMQDSVSDLAKFCSDDWLHTVWFHDWVECITTHDIIKYTIVLTSSYFRFYPSAGIVTSYKLLMFAVLFLACSTMWGVSHAYVNLNRCRCITALLLLQLQQ